MSAFVFLATFVPKIPIPLGYAHLGDVAIVLSIMYCGRKIGILSSIIGSAFSDFLSGFPIWIIPTIFVKAAESEIFYKLYKKNFYIALVTANIVVASGYTLFGAVLYGSLIVGLTSALGLFMDAALNIFVSVILNAALKNKNINT